MDLYNIIQNHIPSEFNTAQYLFLLGCGEGDVKLLEWIHFYGFIDMTFENNIQIKATHKKYYNQCTT